MNLWFLIQWTIRIYYLDIYKMVLFQFQKLENFVLSFQRLLNAVMK